MPRIKRTVTMANNDVHLGHAWHEKHIVCAEDGAMDIIDSESKSKWLVQERDDGTGHDVLRSDLVISIVYHFTPEDNASAARLLKGDEPAA